LWSVCSFCALAGAYQGASVFPWPAVSNSYACVCTSSSLQIPACSAGTDVSAAWQARLGQQTSSPGQKNKGACKLLQHRPGCPAGSFPPPCRARTYQQLGLRWDLVGLSFDRSHWPVKEEFCKPGQISLAGSS